MGQSTFSRSAGDAEQGGVAGAPEGCAATERYLGRLEKWAVRSLLTVGKGKCQVLCLGRRRAVGCCLESKKRTWDRLTINQFRNKKHPGLLKNIQWGEGAYPPTLVSAQRTTTGPVHSPRLSSTVKDGHSGASATRTTKGLECLSREGLRQLGQFVLKKRWSKGISSMHIYI